MSRSCLCFSRRLKPLTLLFIVAAVVAGVVSRQWPRTRAQGPAPKEGIVAYVVDGDTFTLASGARIRLLDIDAPEMSAKGKELDRAKAATRLLKKLLPRGARVRLSYGPRVRDRYDRFLSYCYVTEPGSDNEVFVNLKLAEQGLARVYRGKGHGKNYQDISKAEAEARSAKQGIWSR